MSLKTVISRFNWRLPNGSNIPPGPVATPGTQIGSMIVKGSKKPAREVRQFQTFDHSEFE